MEGVQSYVRRILRVFNHLVRFNLSDLISFLSLDGALLDGFNFLFFAFFRRRTSNFQDLIRLYRVFVWLVLHAASFVIRFSRFYGTFLYAFGIFLFRATGRPVYFFHGCFGHRRALVVFFCLDYGSGRSL